MPIKSAFYIDGFNFYHAVDALGQPFLKWMDYWRMAEIMIPSRDEVLEKVVLCTAYYPDFQKKVRHERYVRALQNCGVEVILGHYVKEPAECRSCHVQWRKPTEKETDINVALALFDDAYQDVYDHAYLVTADSDQAATARLFRQRFPQKQLTSVVPPGREPSKDILGYTQSQHKKVSVDLLEKAILPKVVPGLNGSAAVLRPAEYDPPANWVHPNDRPR